MNKHFKPLLAAAFAAGLIPALDQIGVSHFAVGATVDSFSFESLTTSSAAASSYSLIGDSGLATLSLVKTATGGTLGTVGGNGSAHALTGTGFLGAALTFKFSIDDLTNVVFSFDAAGSGTAPKNYVVQYSFDGSTYSTLGNVAVPSSITYLNSTGGTNTATNFAAGTSVAGFNNSFALPSNFSDSATGVAGDFAYIQILQSGTAPIAGTSTGAAASTGTPRFDNVLITADSAVPEPASLGIMTLAAAGALARRRKA